MSNKPSPRLPGKEEESASSRSRNRPSRSNGSEKAPNPMDARPSTSHGRSGASQNHGNAPSEPQSPSLQRRGAIRHAIRRPRAQTTTSLAEMQSKFLAHHETSFTDGPMGKARLPDACEEAFTPDYKKSTGYFPPGLTADPTDSPILAFPSHIDRPGPRTNSSSAWANAPRRPPPRPKTPMDYQPGRFDEPAPEDTAAVLRNAARQPRLVKVHTLSADLNGARRGKSSPKVPLYRLSTLPRLKIPDAKKAAEQALNSPCSAGPGVDGHSPSSGRLLLSPTSNALSDHIVKEYPDDVIAELRNMRSARRRVRKGPFGRRVAEYFEARQNWDTSGHLYADEDVAHLAELEAALQQQKDIAERLARQVPGKYPELRNVNVPSCSQAFFTPEHPSQRTKYWKERLEEGMEAIHVKEK
ncbi:hypothetical protein F4779DRAFT_34860 [Xylariaceae sp. FL0662B]|nr:hypothetical protein F4779DRAFT_34860 [Xylariaceae sp. FL0662B]